MKTEVIGEVQYKIPFQGEAGAIPTQFTITVKDEKLTLPSQWHLSQCQIKNVYVNATKIEASTAHGNLELKINVVELVEENIYFYGTAQWIGNEEIIYSSVGELSFPKYHAKVKKGLYLMEHETEGVKLGQYIMRKRCFRRLFWFDIEDSLTFGGKEITRELLEVASAKTDTYSKLDIQETEIQKKIRNWLKKNNRIREVAEKIQDKKLMALMNKKEWPPELDEAAQKINEWMIEAKGITLQEYIHLICA